MLTRRGFLSGILAACVAPAIVRPDSLMPVWSARLPFATESVSDQYLQVLINSDGNYIAVPSTYSLSHAIEKFGKGSFHPGSWNLSRGDPGWAVLDKFGNVVPSKENDHKGRLLFKTSNGELILKAFI